MAIIHSLFGGTVTDTTVQVAKENQIIIWEGPGARRDRLVIFNVERRADEYIYHMVDTETKKIRETNILNPLSQKFGIGMYYDDRNPEFMDAFEVALLREEAQKKATEEAEEAERERIRCEQVEQIGRKRLAEILPANAKAVIVARLKEDKSDIMTDYFASSTARTVILGFSTHTRDLFSEMRKYASNLPDTAYLAEKNEEYEQREKYSMGAGYYLGKSRYQGWIIQKVPIYNRERIIEDFAYIAGNEDNIHLSKQKEKTCKTAPSEEFTIVDYSEKAIAVFGNTKPIKDELISLGGRFNSRLTYDGQKKAGWIFQKCKEGQVRELLNMSE